MTEIYLRPPVTEALVELRFSGSASAGALEAVATKLRREYPKSEDIHHVTVRIEQGRPTSESSQTVGRKLTSADGLVIVQLMADRLSVSHLAPYSGWSSLIAKVRSAVSKAAPLVRGRPLSRLGVRYINRLDIPLAGQSTIDYRSYLVAGIGPIPFEHDADGAFAYNYSTTVETGRFGVILNVGGAPSPLIGYASLALDIDVFNLVDLPKTRSGMWEQLDEMRAWKNKIFESSITEKSRELFR